jgi:opacity protein-like surface antigen
MKRIHLVSVLATACCVAGLAAQSNADALGTVELNLGYAKTSTEFGLPDTPGGGLAFGAGYWRGATPQLSWGVEGSYDNFGSVEDQNTTVSARTIRINPALRFNLGTMVGPSFYLQGGAGYYNLGATVESLGSKDSASDGKLGFNLGAGVGFPLAPKARANLQGQYHSIATEGESTNYMALRAGVGFGI